jgi:hypothetical protein
MDGSYLPSQPIPMPSGVQAVPAIPTTGVGQNFPASAASGTSSQCAWYDMSCRMGQPAPSNSLDPLLPPGTTSTPNAPGGPGPNAPPSALQNATGAASSTIQRFWDWVTGLVSRFGLIILGVIFIAIGAWAAVKGEFKPVERIARHVNRTAKRAIT